MSKVPLFNENHFESLARILGEVVTGTQLNNIFRSCDIKDMSGESTKWKRIHFSLIARQRQDHCGKSVAAFIQAVMSPARFINDRQRFQSARQNLNAVLSFEGLELDEAGQFRQVTIATTITEAQERTGILMARLQGRSIHPEAMKYCRAELLQDDYFHAVLEAVKSLAQRIRDITGLTTDGAELVDQALALRNPLIRLNELKSETDRSEHLGVAMLLKGCFSAARNPSAHEPRLLWRSEDDAADYLTLVSLLHRKLDGATSVARRDADAHQPESDRR